MLGTDGACLNLATFRKEEVSLIITDAKNFSSISSVW